jgi:glycosyltransferase involved in cell wall biosynthesis
MCEIKKRVAVQHNPLNTYSTVARKADQVCANLGVYWRNVTVATAVTKSVAGYSIMASGRVRTIYNGLRAAPFPFSCSERLDIRRRFGLPLDKPLIVNIGRIAAQKNQSVLIPLMHHFPGSFLAIVGDGPLSTTLQRQIIESGLSKNVRMLGSQDSADVRLLLRSSDLFITPSHFEAMPMVVLEAMQESAVIVASNIEAHRELLADAGLVVPATVEGLRSAVQQLLDNAELRATLSQRAIERSRVFSEEAMVNKYLELLTEKP